MDGSNTNSLHYAAFVIQGEKNVEVFKFFIKEKKADHRSLLNGEFNLLHTATIQAGNIGLVEYIVQKFPDLLSQETFDESLLEFAQYMNNEEIVRILQRNLDKKRKGLCGAFHKNCSIHW
jgi:hypothetical protein